MGAHLLINESSPKVLKIIFGSWDVSFCATFSTSILFLMLDQQSHSFVSSNGDKIQLYENH